MQLSPAQWAEVEDLFDEARQQPAEARAALLQRTKDPAVRDEVASLLAADTSDDHLLRAGAPLVAPAPQPQASLPPGTRLGPWRLLERIGRGGMGEVFAGERVDGAFQQSVAIKVLKRGLDTEQLLARFLRERRILARLRHPGIAGILDAGATDDGRPYLVMERVSGVPITQWCDDHATDVPGVLRLMAQVCDAVQEAHRNLIVHRDLKPANVLVSDDGRVKLLDFGIAKLLDQDDADSTQTLAAAPMTPAYAAPEQILGHPVTTAADVYALGVLLYRLLTGQLPHKRGTLLEAAASLIDTGTERPSIAARALDPQRSAALSGDLDLIVLKALHHEPERRYRSAADLGADLDHFLHLRPVKARPDSLDYRIRQFVRRNRLGVAMASAAAMLVLVALGVALWQAHTARVASRLAQAQSRRAEHVLHFLLDIFEQADPTRTQGASLPVRQVVDMGERNVRSTLHDEPEVRAELLSTLASIYASIGVTDRARALAEESLALQRTLVPRNDPSVAERLYTLAHMRANGGDFGDDVRALVTEAQAIGQAQPRPDPLARARLDSVLATIGSGRDEREGNVAIRRRTVEAFVSVMGAGAPDTLSERVELGNALISQGDYPGAELELRAAVAGFEHRPGPPDYRAGRAHLALGGVLDAMGRPEEADAELQKAIAQVRGIYGDRHPELGLALFDRANLLIGRARYAEAEQLLRETLKIFPEGSLYAAQSHRYLGLALMYDGRNAEAEPEFRTADTAYRGAGSHVQAFRAVADLGGALMFEGRRQEAEPLLREAVAGLERIAGPDSYEVRGPRKRLANLLADLGRTSEALPLLRSVREREVGLFGTEDHRDLAVTDFLLARVLLETRNADDRREARTRIDHSVGLYRKNFPGRFCARALVLSAKLHLEDREVAPARAELIEALEQMKADAKTENDDRVEAEALLRKVAG